MHGRFQFTELILRHQIATFRAKDPDKLFEKIVRKKKAGKQYNRLEEIEDLAAARIVFYLEKDRHAFINDLESRLGSSVILKTQVQDKANGYRATHLILTLDEARLALPEYAEFKGLKCELQVTSALYHAWSEVEHDITYKPGSDGELFEGLGFERLQEKFKELHQHIQGAAIQLDLIHEDYVQIKEFGHLLNLDIVNEIEISSNERIIEILILARKFADKKPDETYLAVETVFAKAASDPNLTGSFGDFILWGRTHRDVKLVALNILDGIRYLDPERTLALLAKVTLDSEASVRAKALEVLKSFCAYNFPYIQITGSYDPQSSALRFLNSWSSKECHEHLDFVEAVCSKILSPLVEGSRMTAEDKLTVYSGAVSATHELRSIRRETIELLYRLMEVTKKVGTKIRILNILESAFTISRESTDENSWDMIQNDAAQLLSIYERMVLGKNRRLKGPLPVLLKIESRLYWWSKWSIGGTNVGILRDKMLADPFYGVVRVLIGDPHAFRSEEVVGETEKDRKVQILELVSDVTKASLKKWDWQLSKIAREREGVDEWWYEDFRGFVRELSNRKPALASSILHNAITRKTPLTNFSDAFLEGFRVAGSVAQYDRYVKLALASRDSNLVKALVSGLLVSRQANPLFSFRMKDIELLKNIVNRRNEMDFLDASDDKRFQDLLFRVLSNALASHKKQIEPLLRVQIKCFPECFTSFASILVSELRLEPIEMSDLSKATRRLLRAKLVGLNNLSWIEQSLLLELGKTDDSLPFEVFIARMRLEEKKRARPFGQTAKERYVSIPFDLNEKLAEFLVSSPSFSVRTMELLEEMTDQWGSYNWNIPKLIGQLGSGGISALKTALEHGGVKRVKSVALCISKMKDVDLDLCMLVVEKSDSKDIDNLVKQAILSTGVLCGEYGTVEHCQKRAIEIEKYSKRRSKRVREFVNTTAESLRKYSETERVKVEDELAQRKRTFDYQH